MVFLAIILFLPTIAIAVQAKEGDRYCNIDGISKKYNEINAEFFKQWAIKVGEKCKYGDTIRLIEREDIISEKIALVCDLKRSVVLVRPGIAVCTLAPHTYYAPTD